MRSSRRWSDRVGRQMRYTRLGFRLARIAGDRRSGMRLAVLGTTILWRRLLPRRLTPSTVDVRLHGERFKVTLMAGDELDVLREIGLDDEYGIADGIQGGTIVDLGANVGFATLRLLAGHPGSRVIAVGAGPALIPRLRANVAGQPVTVVHAAIADSGGERLFYRSDNASMGNSLTRIRSWQVPVSVPSLSLDELLDAHGIEAVDLLKIDVEGAEWQVFEQGAPSRVRSMVGEIHAMENADPDQLIAKLSSAMELEIVRRDATKVLFVGRRAEAPA